MKETAEQRKERYRRMGSLGGKARVAQLGVEGMSALGKRGGATIAARGPDYFQRIGRQGGQKVAAARDAEYFRTIGRKGGLVFSKSVRDPTPTGFTLTHTGRPARLRAPIAALQLKARHRPMCEAFRRMPCDCEGTK